MAVRINRRQATSLSLAAAFAADSAVGAEGPLLHTVPSSGERLPVVGVGTNSFRRDDLDELRGMLRGLLDQGGTVVDTAAAYGDSEELIGQLVAQLGVRRRLFLSSKLVGDGVPHTDGPGALGAEWDAITGRASFERSLKRLRTDHLDLLQVHSLLGLERALPLMVKWKQAGEVRYIGATTANLEQHDALLQAMRRYPLDFIEVDYSLADRDAAMAILPLAQLRKIGVIVDLPFGGKRRTLISQAAERAPTPPEDVGEHSASWAQFFLRYVISHPAVTCVVPGSTRLAHLLDNQAAAHAPPLSAGDRRQMEGWWDRLAAAG